ASRWPSATILFAATPASPRRRSVNHLWRRTPMSSESNPTSESNQARDSIIRPLARGRLVSSKYASDLMSIGGRPEGSQMCRRKSPPLPCAVVFRTWYVQVGVLDESFRLPLPGGACTPLSRSTPVVL